jgi:hypothetical protein
MRHHSKEMNIICENMTTENNKHLYMLIKRLPQYNKHEDVKISSESLKWHSDSNSFQHRIKITIEINEKNE